MFYYRRYDFPAIYTEDSELEPYKEHFTKILETLQGARDRNLSSIVFFNTIAECETFYEFLNANGIKQDDLLLFDDTVTDEDMNKKNNYKTGEKTVLGNCRIPGKITITTAAGGRATDFKDVDVGIVAKPVLLRILIQLLGRVGRNGSFAITHQIYSKLDIDEKMLIPSKAKKVLGINDKSSKAERILGYRESNILGPSDDNILQIQRQKQEQDLIDSLSQRRGAPLAIFKLNIQKEFYAALNNPKNILDQQNYSNQFQEFYGNLESLWNQNKSNPEQQKRDIIKQWNDLGLDKILSIQPEISAPKNDRSIN